MKPLEGHPSVSGEFLTRVGCGDIAPKGVIDRLDGDGVIFADGSREELDAIIWAISTCQSATRSKSISAPIAGI